jgi:DNA polymerase III subunit chi
MSEIWFYHLERQPLDAVLPELLQKTLARGWRAVVHAGSDERVAALDALLWTYTTDGFLPHGTSADGFAKRQPIFLTSKAERPNAADVIFFVDGALPKEWPEAEGAAVSRMVLLFDGNDPDATSAARAEWKRIKNSGADATYWQQSAAGKWEKKS